MCMSKPPKPEPPAPEPAPAPETPSAPELNEGTKEKWAVSANKNGRNSLRIDLGTQVPGSGGNGANIPGNT